jgi:Nif-specific regulatory protein
MENALAFSGEEVEILKHNLLSTLDESVFFSNISRFFESYVTKSDRIQIYQILHDQRSRLIIDSGRIVHDGIIYKKGEFAPGHLVQTKRPYFSNNISRDPVFSTFKTDQSINSELCVPIMHEGVILATVHFQSEKVDQFGLEDINLILAILHEIKTPMANMKMYIAAKYLNEALSLKVEERERELDERKSIDLQSMERPVKEDEILGQSSAIFEMVALSDKVAKCDINLTIEGESGTGRETLAKRIHCRSARGSNLFRVVDCSSMSAIDLEKKLFGEEIYDNNGLNIIEGIFEEASNGTVLIREVSHMPLSIQGQLVRMIETKSAQRVNGRKAFNSSARIIATSNTNLVSAVEDGSFRSDLFFILNNLNIKTIPLRSRTDDIEYLANFFLNRNRAVADQKVLGPSAVKILGKYTWPGNIRELQNTMDRLHILSEGNVIDETYLKDLIDSIGVQEGNNNDNSQAVEYVQMTLGEIERNHICRTLDHLQGNKTKTAKILGITVKTLYNKLHSYGLIQNKEA